MGRFLSKDNYYFFGNLVHLLVTDQAGKPVG